MNTALDLLVARLYYVASPGYSMCMLGLAIIAADALAPVLHAHMEPGNILHLPLLLSR